MGGRNWSILGGDTYRIVWNGDQWLLQSTRGGRYPWLLVKADGSDGQDIGSPDLATAQRVAEMWLDLSSTGIYPREGRFQREGKRVAA